MTDPVMKELLHNIAASKAITKAAIEQGVLVGRREGLSKLDQAWAEINALGGDLGKPDSYTDGFAHAISMALAIIEKLGGMDPQKRAKE